MERNNVNYLIKFNRILIWITLVLSIVFVISGYGITNPRFVSDLTGGIFNRARSLTIHIQLAFMLLILLTTHVLIGAKSALTRWGVKNETLLNVFLLVLGFFAITLLTLMQYYIL